MKKILTISMLVMASTMANALNRSTTADGNWTNNAIWNTAPTAIDTAWLNHAVNVDSDVAITVVRVGRTQAGSLAIDSSGKLITSGNLIIGDRYAGTGSIDGGFVGITGALNIGSGGATYPQGDGMLAIGNNGTLTNSGRIAVAPDGTGSLTLNSGSIVSLGNLVLGNTNSMGTATVNLLGGTASFDNVTFDTAADLLNIENGVLLTLNTNRLSVIAGFVASGNITWDNGDVANTSVGDMTWDNGAGSYLHADFDSGTAKTTVWVNQTIPEPATLGLVAFAGAAVLIIRRRFRI